MSAEFDRSVYRERLIKGNLRAAMDYVSQFPDQAELRGKYRSLFQEENYLAYDAEADLNQILLDYQKYYRDVFYLELSPEDAVRRLRDRLAARFREESDLDGLESRVSEAFRAGGYFFLGGRTGGFYGPYVWRTEELRQYAVELPDGKQDYAVKLLDGFVMLSWLDYISFGALGTGGWSNGDGLIHCVRPRYDLDSESFQVSLLKHEAQHAADHERFPGMSAEDLEYRAKLVELIYTRERNLLLPFSGEADAARAENSHGLAAKRIVDGFAVPPEQLAALSVEEIQATAKRLFAASTEESARKYKE